MVRVAVLRFRTDAQRVLRRGLEGPSTSPQPCPCGRFCSGPGAPTGHRTAASSCQPPGKITPVPADLGQMFPRSWRRLVCGYGGCSLSEHTGRGVWLTVTGAFLLAQLMQSRTHGLKHGSQIERNQGE